jgi:adenosylcobinamide-phosphate synthase
VTVALCAYLIDMFWGEFRCIKHPISYMGDLIQWCEKRLYRDSVARGGLLWVVVVGLSAGVAGVVEWSLSSFPIPMRVVALSLIASLFLAHRMLCDAVRAVVSAEDRRAAVGMLVSRDTATLNESEVNKAAIETYAENLSDGVIAPLLYLLIGGVTGIVIYKAINTLDSMVGYRTPRYERFGKVAARVDDLANYLPARLTALIILAVGRRAEVGELYRMGRLHESPNAGYPITAMALLLGVKLGGDTRYFGVLKKKPFFGRGRESIGDDDVLRAVKWGRQIDVVVVAGLAGGVGISFVEGVGALLV